MLDLFAVPDDVRPVPGGSGRSVVAGDLVLSPVSDPTARASVSPVLARFAVALDEEPGRSLRDLRLAVPVPARDGSWVVEGWAASRYEPDTVACHDLAVLRAAGRLLHARLASAVPRRPSWLEGTDDRRSHAESVAFGEAEADVAATADSVLSLLDRVAAAREGVVVQGDLGPDQLVHVALDGHLMIDPDGAPVVHDVTPAWRPAQWADALCVLDGVLARRASTDVLDEFRAGRPLEAMLRAVVFRLLEDETPDSTAYGLVLRRLGV